VSLSEVEKNYIQHVLTKVKGNKSKASRILQISRPTLDKKISDYNIKV
jgi:two-component system response regulator AtoC